MRFAVLTQERDDKRIWFTNNLYSAEGAYEVNGLNIRMDVIIGRVVHINNNGKYRDIIGFHRLNYDNKSNTHEENMI